MNWSDAVVIGIIMIFAIVGLKNGFIYSIFRLASFFLSIILSVKFYPVVSRELMKTTLYTNMKHSIQRNLMLQQPQLQEAGNGVGHAGTEAVIEKLHLPEFIKDVLLDRIPNPSRLVDMTKIADAVSGELARLVIDVISLFLLYVLIRIALVFLRFILQGISKLPVFKQMDKMGGVALGSLEGLLTIYIVFAVLMLFHSSPQFTPVFDMIDNSLIARFFYENNFIVDWMFPKESFL